VQPFFHGLLAEPLELDAVEDGAVERSRWVLAMGGEKGGKVHLVDTHSGYEITPELLPEGPDGKIMQLTVPGVFSYRTCKLTMLTPGTIFYGLRTVRLSLPNECPDRLTFVSRSCSQLPSSCWG